jgi:outer membrane protein TolC
MKSFPSRITLLVLLSAVHSAARAGEAAAPAGGVEITAEFIDRLMAETQGHNPALQAAGARADAASSAVAAVRTWDDPTASFGLWGSTSRGFEASQEGNLVYGLDQKLPLYGRPDLQRRLAAADASREGLASDLESQELRRDLQVALYGLALAGREAEVAQLDWSGLTPPWTPSTTSTASDGRARWTG